MQEAGTGALELIKFPWQLSPGHPSSRRPGSSARAARGPGASAGLPGRGARLETPTAPSPPELGPPDCASRCDPRGGPRPGSEGAGVGVGLAARVRRVRSAAGRPRRLGSEGAGAGWTSLSGFGGRRARVDLSTRSAGAAPLDLVARVSRLCGVRARARRRGLGFSGAGGAPTGRDRCSWPWSSWRSF